MIQQNDPIIFLEVPESLRGAMETESDENDFTIDPAFPLPVESNAEGIENLSNEMILAGMLRVISRPGDYSDSLKPGALTYYRQFVLAIKPDLPREFTAAAIAKSQNGDKESALEILNMLRSLLPGNPSILYNRALILSSFNDEESQKSAVFAYDELLSLEPPFPDGFFNAAFFYMNRGDYAQAKDCLRRYLELSDDIPDEMDQKQKEAKRLLKEIETNALDDDLFSEACTLVRDGREEEALPLIKEFLEEHPEAVSGAWKAWFLLGWALRRLERWQDGAAALERSLEIALEQAANETADIRNELAICLMELGHLDQARKQLETALLDDGDNVKIISNLGVLALRQRRPGEAERFFRTALEIDPNDPIAKAYIQ